MFFDDFTDRFFDMDFGRRTRQPFGLSSRLRRELGVPRDMFSTTSSRLSSSTSSNDSDRRLKLDKDGLQMQLNVYQFSPNDITVKIVDDLIIIEGKHEEKQDEHGYVTRQFTRRYKLPKDYDAKDVISSMSSDGVLTIKAPAIVKTPAVNERVVTIQKTGPANPPPAESSASSESGPKETNIPIKEEMN